MRAYLITIENGELTLRCFARPMILLMRGEELWQVRRSITEITATLKQLEEELFEAASAATVAEDGERGAP